MTDKLRKAVTHLAGIDREHADEAVEAVRALGVLGFEALCAALDTPEALNVPRARHALKDLLAMQPGETVAPFLLKALAHVDWRPNQVAADVIGLMRATMMPILINNLHTEGTPHGRLNTIMCLRRMGASAASSTLARIVREDACAEVRAAAVEALGYLGGDEAAAAVTVALTDASPDVRLKAVKAAGWLRAREAVDGILAFAGGADAEGRAAALYALDRIGDNRASAFAVACLGDAEPYVRWSAAVALRRLWQPDCEAPLRAVLNDPESPVVAAVVETLRIAAPDRAPDGPAPSGAADP